MFYVTRRGNNFTAKRSDGWCLAQCSRDDISGVYNGMHDGTDEGKDAFQALIKEHETEMTGKGPKQGDSQESGV